MTAKTKHIGVECCGILAMLMICNLHVLGMGGILRKLIVKRSLLYFCKFLEGFSYSAVNIYILISGYVGLYSQFSYKKCLVFGYRLFSIPFQLLLYLLFFQNHLLT